VNKETAVRKSPRLHTQTTRCNHTDRRAECD
jgi:hypothetical protein